MKLHKRFVALLSAGGLFCLSAQAADPQVVGWVERARLDPGGLTVRAKLDTGAKRSSISAVDTEEFKRGGERWIAFSMTNDEGTTVRFEQPVTRVARIRRAGAYVQERPVIRLGVCIGKIYAETDFTLTNRANMDYPVLIGRRFLANGLLVDSNKTFAVKPVCQPPRNN